MSGGGVKSNKLLSTAIGGSGVKSNKLLSAATLGGAARNITNVWLLRDEFDVALTAGNVDGTYATDGVNQRKATDTGSNLSISGGNAVFAVNALGWDDPGIAYEDYEITTTVDTATLLWSYASSDANVAIGFDASNTAYARPGFWFKNDNSLAATPSMGGIITIFVDTGKLITHGAIINSPTTQFFFVKENGRWLYLASYETTTGTVHPYIAAYGEAFPIGFIRAPQAKWLPTPALSDSYTLTPTISDSGSNGLDATAYNVGLGGSGVGARAAGTASYIDIYSSGFNTLFDGDECTVIVGLSPDNDYGDSFTGNPYAYQLGVDTTTYRIAAYRASNGNLITTRVAGGETASVSTPLSGTDEIVVGVTLSVSSNEFLTYFDGVAGGTDTATTSWSGALSSSYNLLLAPSKASTNVWDGRSRHFVYGVGAATPAEVQTISTAMAAGTLTTTILDGIFGAGNYMWLPMDEQYAADGLGHPEGVTGGIGSGGTATYADSSYAYNSGGARLAGVVAGAELVTNGSFDADTDWTKGTGWTIAAGVATHASGSAGALLQTINYIGWATYGATVSNRTAGNVDFSSYNCLITSVGSDILENAAHVFTNYRTGNGNFGAYANSTFDGDLDDYWMKPLTLASLMDLYDYGTPYIYGETNYVIGDGLQAGWAVLVDDADNPTNYVEAFHDKAANVIIRKSVAGVYTTLATVAATYDADAKTVIRTTPNASAGVDVWVWYNDVKIYNGTVTDANLPAAQDSGSNGLHGEYDSTVVRNGSYATFDGASGISIQNVNPLFDGNTGTILQYFAPDAWTDGELGYGISLYVDVNNSLYMRKQNTDNTARVYRKAGGTDAYKDMTMSAAGVMGMTFDSVTTGEMKGYVDGAQFGSTLTSISTWTHGSFSADGAGIGTNSTATFSLAMTGAIRDTVIGFGTAASDAEMLTLSTAMSAGTLTTADLDTVFGAGNYAWYKLDEAAGDNTLHGLFSTSATNTPTATVVYPSTGHTTLDKWSAA